MNNHAAIISMTPERMAQFLDQVFLTGVNIGIYSALHDDDNYLEINPYDETWLSAPAEDATAKGFDETEDEYMLHALVEAILHSAGITEQDEA